MSTDRSPQAMRIFEQVADLPPAQRAAKLDGLCAGDSGLRTLVDACRRQRVPVVFTQFIYAKAVPCLRGDPFGPEHLPARPSQPTGFSHPSGNCLIGPEAGQGPNSADIILELAPLPDELVIQGHTYDKFYGTPLDLALRSQDIRCLIITGKA